jgi:hypothetical protein
MFLRGRGEEEKSRVKLKMTDSETQFPFNHVRGKKKSLTYAKWDT